MAGPRGRQGWRAALGLLLALALAPAAPAAARPWQPVPVSVDAKGAFGEGGANTLSVSSDGRRAAFESWTPLTPEDDNMTADVILWERGTGPRLVSLGYDGATVPEASVRPTISADGNFVAFLSTSRRLVQDDGGDGTGVYVADLREGAPTIERINGVGGDAGGWAPAISDDGRYVAWTDYGLGRDVGVYVFDRATRERRHVSVGGDGAAAAISGDGKVVAFESVSALVPEDANGNLDVYAEIEGNLRLVSAAASGEAATGASFAPSLDLDGGLVSFSSDAKDLVPEGDNEGVDVFVRDLAEGRTEVASLGGDGAPVQGNLSESRLSPDGRFVTWAAGGETFFDAAAPAACRGNTDDQIAVRDRLKRTTFRASRTEEGVPAAGWSWRATPVTGPAGFVGYLSAAANLAEGDLNRSDDAFVTQLPEDPADPVLVAVSDAGVREDGGALTFEITACRPLGTDEAVEVEWAAASRTATEGEDYEAAGGTAVFEPGESSVTVQVPVRDDEIEEGGERLALELAPSPAIARVRAAGRGVIADDDNFGAPGPVIFERGGAIVSLAPGVTEPTTIVEGGRDPAVSPDGTQLAWTVYNSRFDREELWVGSIDGQGRLFDFVYSGYGLGQPAWSPDGRELAIGLRLLETGDAEIARYDVATGYSTRVASVTGLEEGLAWSPDGTTLALEFTECDGESCWPFGIQRVGLLDIDSGRLTTLADGVKPAYAPNGDLAFTRHLFGAPHRIAIVPYGTTELRTFDPGPVPEDSGDLGEYDDRSPAFAPDGRALVWTRYGGLVTAPLDGTKPPTRLTPPGEDDDPEWARGLELPAVSIADVSVSESAQEATLTVTASPAPAQSVTVEHRTQNGTAKGGEDYTSGSGTLTIGPGGTATITVPLLPDVLHEGDEHFTVELSNPVGATLADGVGRVDLRDDDLAPVLDLEDADELDEGGTLFFRATLDAPSAVDATFTVSTEGGTAGAGDYTPLKAEPVRIAAGQRTVAVPVVTAADNVVESLETVRLVVDAGGSGFRRGRAEAFGTIIDDDEPTVAVDDVTVSEADDTALLDVRLPAPASRNVQVSVYTEDGTARSGADYRGGEGSLTIPAGQTSVPLPIGLMPDDVHELTETFAVYVSTSGNEDRATVTILDDDAPRLTLAGARVAEGGVLTFPLSLDRAPVVDVLVDLAVANGTATAADYVRPSSLRVRIPAGSQEGAFTVQTVEDQQVEGDETITVRAAQVTGAVAPQGAVTGTIVNDDAAPVAQRPTARIGAAAVTEGGVLRFPVTLSTASTTEVVARLATSDGTARAPADYDAVTTDVRIPAGALTGTLAVPTAQDPLEEPDETLRVSLVSVTGADGAGAQATGTIRADGDQVTPPRVGRSSAAEVESGTVAIRLPGSRRFTTVVDARQLPVGTEIDARRGAVELFTALRGGGEQRAVFSAGLFKFTQSRRSDLVTLTLTGPELDRCARRGGKANASARKRRRLWGRGKGSFRTKGRYSAATVLGTHWLTEDRCTSTLTRVREGVVSVQDLATKKRKRVRAGQKLVVKAPRR